MIIDKNGGIYMFANIIKEIIENNKNNVKVINQKDIALSLGMTKQSFSNKMQRDTFTVNDAVKIANYFGMNLILKGEGEDEYIIK